MSHVDDTAVQAGRAAASAVVRPSGRRRGAGLLREAPAGAQGERSDTRDGWRGWPGEKVWYSPEREFDLRATSDRRGHITLKICVVPPVPSPPWRFECNVPLEAGQLDRVAVEIRSFVEGTG
jgi:hypothetical protein